MNASFLSDPEQPGPAYEVGRGTTRTERTDPSPNETGSAMRSNDIVDDTFLNPEPSAVFEPSGTFGQYQYPGPSLSPGKTARLGMSGDPREAEQFTTDGLELRTPESLAWNGNTQQVGLGPLGGALIDKEFNDLRSMQSVDDRMESDVAVPETKTAWFKAGRHFAQRVLQCP